jgi:preprotein translocase subunit YajC
MDQTQQVPQILNVLPIIVILFLFYFMIIIPQKKQQKKHEEMLAALKKNDTVVTVGGLHGVIVNVKEKTFVLRVDDNTRVEVDKAAVSYKV